MSNPEQPSPENELRSNSTIELLDRELLKHANYSSVVMAMARYLEREHQLDDVLLNQLMSDRTLAMPFPTDDEYHEDPEQAVSKARLFVFGALVPLYQETHTPYEAVKWLPDALNCALGPEPHNALFCKPDLKSEVTTCDFGECPYRTITASLVSTIDNLGYEFPAGHVSEDDINKRELDLISQVNCLYYTLNVLNDEDTRLLRGTLGMKSNALRMASNDLATQQESRPE